MDEAVLVLDMVEDTLMLELWNAEAFCAEAVVASAGYGGRVDPLGRSMLIERCNGGTEL